MSDEAKEKKLTAREKRFCIEYVKCGNAAKAARDAGYSEKTARVIASNLLSKVYIKDEINRLHREYHLGEDEALRILSDHARGDVAQLMDVSGVGFNLDMRKAQELGLTRLIRKVRQKTTIYNAKSESDEDREVTELEIELYSAKDAIDTILKVGGKLQNSDITINVKLTDD